MGEREREEDGYGEEWIYGGSQERKGYIFIPWRDIKIIIIIFCQ